MPTINIFYNDAGFEAELKKVTASLKKYAAEQLTCGDIELSPDEVSVRFLKNESDGMLAPVELEISAAAFKERVDKQDQICLNIQKLLLNKLQIPDIKVWLILSELGHSWE